MLSGCVLKLSPATDWYDFCFVAGATFRVTSTIIKMLNMNSWPIQWPFSMTNGNLYFLLHSLCYLQELFET